VACYGVVVALVDGGERVGLGFADVVDFLYVRGCVVGEAELGKCLSWGGKSYAQRGNLHI
jgi:hypothetical protein